MMTIFAVLLFFIAAGFYIATAYGWYRVYKRAGYTAAWLAFVPYADNILFGRFHQEYLNDAVWVRWFLSFYWIVTFLTFLPDGLISFISLTGWVSMQICMIRFLRRYGGDAASYVFLFLLPVLYPYSILKIVEPREWR